MAGKNTAVFGIYASRSAAEAGVDQLNAAGFSNNDISVLLSSSKSSEEFAHEKNTKAPEGTTTGVVAGGAIGGTLGLLAGIGALAIPGVGPLIAAGPIMAALAGVGVGGATGGIIGALVGLGIPEYEAKRYEGRVKDGGVLLSVHCDTSDEISRAKDVLKQTGADDIASSGEKSVSSHNVDSDRDRRSDDVRSSREYSRSETRSTGALSDADRGTRTYQRTDEIDRRDLENSTLTDSDRRGVVREDRDVLDDRDVVRDRKIG